MSEYISIKDFANKAGVSPQAIYQRLDKDLKTYFKVIEGKKTLDIKGLGLFCFKEVEQEIDKQLTSALQETLKVLTSQIEVKDKQLEVKDIQIAELNERLKEAQELNKNNQILLGAEQSRTNSALMMSNGMLLNQNKEISLKKKSWQFWKK